MDIKKILRTALWYIPTDGTEERDLREEIERALIDSPKDSKAKTPALYQHLRAPHSPNGNPQRLYIVYEADGSVLNVIDEGYRGLRPELRNLKQLPSVEISRSSYHEWKREFKAAE